MLSERFVAECLATTFLDGEWTERSLLARTTPIFGRRPRGLVELVRHILTTFSDPSTLGPEKLADFIRTDTRFVDHLRHAPVRQLQWPAPVMEPTPDAIRGWDLPSITSPGQLADWLGVTLPLMDWFADVRQRNRRASLGSLRHYTYHIIRKRDGRIRLLEAPKPRLKAIQRRILSDLLNRVPAHDAAHGFRPGRSVLTYAAPHTAKAMVLRMDLCDFFASIAAARVRALFRTLGYPREVAHLLTGLCTHATPDDAWPPDPSAEAWLTRRRHADAHLPQGAPTSPALANLCAYRLDIRLSALAAAVGACYTRYADDLAFSGGPDFARGVNRFHVQACRVALEEGFEVRFQKTRRLRPGVRQHLAGVVVNVRPNVGRDEYDRLKAILHNCRRNGPDSQNRAGIADFRAHLLGRVARVASIHPERGLKLRRLIDAISW